jgi:site-specific recombinase XerC
MKPYDTGTADRQSITGGGFTYERAWHSFEIALNAERRSPHTLAAYEVAVRQLGQFVVGMGLPNDVTVLTSEHVREFLADRGQRDSASTVGLKLRLKPFFGFLQDDER